MQTDATILAEIGPRSLIEMFELLDAGEGKPDQAHYLADQFETDDEDGAAVIRAWEASKAEAA